MDKGVKSQKMGKFSILAIISMEKSMEEASLFGKMVQITRDSSFKICSKVLGLFCGLMAEFIMENGEIIWKTEEEICYCKMVVDILDNFKQIIWMDMVYFYGLTAVNTKGFGKTAFKMEKVLTRTSKER